MELEDDGVLIIWWSIISAHTATTPIDFVGDNDDEQSTMIGV